MSRRPGRGLPVLLASLLLASLGPLPAGAQSSGARTPGSASLDTQWFLSNSLGMPLEEIGWYRRDEATYVLEIRGASIPQKRVLTKDGVEVKRWERSDTEERVYEQGELAERVVFDGQGRTLELWEYQRGTLVLRSEYSYPAGGEIQLRTFDSGGKLLYTDRSLLSSRGELRNTRREYAEGGVSRLSLSMAGDRLFEERAGRDGRTLLRRYDTRGRLVELERWADRRLERRETLSYLGESGTPSGSVAEDPVSGRTTSSTFDENGRLVREQVERDGRIVEESRFEWDGEGRKVLAVRRGPLGLEQWKYEYRDDGEPEREEYRLRGSLERVTLYPGEGRTVQELYRDGELLVRVLYVHGKKTREEFLRNGTVVRAKDYQ